MVCVAFLIFVVAIAAVVALGAFVVARPSLPPGRVIVVRRIIATRKRDYIISDPLRFIAFNPEYIHQKVKIYLVHWCAQVLNKMFLFAQVRAAHDARPSIENGADVQRHAARLADVGGVYFTEYPAAN